MRNLDAIIRVPNYVRLNPGLQRARPLWSGASDRLIMNILPAERMTEAVRKLSSEHLEQPTYSNLDSLIPITRNQFFYCVETLYNTVLSVRWDNIIIYAVAK